MLHYELVMLQNCFYKLFSAQGGHKVFSEHGKTESKLGAENLDNHCVWSLHKYSRNSPILFPCIQFTVFLSTCMGQVITCTISQCSEKALV